MNKLVRKELEKGIALPQFENIKEPEREPGDLLSTPRARELAEKYQDIVNSLVYGSTIDQENYGQKPSYSVLGSQISETKTTLSKNQPETITYDNFGTIDDQNPEEFIHAKPNKKKPKLQKNQVEGSSNIQQLQCISEDLQNNFE